MDFFKAGDKGPADAVIQLKVSIKDAGRVYRNHLEFGGLGDAVKLYNKKRKTKDGMRNLLFLDDIFEKEKLDPDRIALELRRIQESCSESSQDADGGEGLLVKAQSLARQVNDLTYEAQSLQARCDSLARQQEALQNDIATFTKLKEQVTAEYRDTTAVLENEVAQKKQALKNELDTPKRAVLSHPQKESCHNYTRWRTSCENVL